MAMVNFRSFSAAGAWSVLIFVQVLHTSARLAPGPAAPALGPGTFRSSALYHKDAVFSSSQSASTGTMSNLKPDSTSWVQTRLGALYEARESEAIATNDTFDAVFSPSCEVRMDHTPSTVDAFKQSVLSRSAASAGVSLAWENVIATSDSPDEPSVVAGTLIVTRSMRFRIRAAPAQRQTHINFSARVEQEPSCAQADEHDDRRRITSFYYTSVDRTPPIHFATPIAVSQEKE